jgi:hypothetical protein
MVFTLFKNGNRVLTTPQIKTTGPTKSVDPETGEQIDLYQSTWSYILSDLGNYHLDVINTCMNTEASSSLPFSFRVHAADMYEDPPVQESFWNKIQNLLSNLTGKNNIQGISAENEVVNNNGNVLAEEESPESLKLGTFEGETPQASTGCRSADFSVVN